jgi:hypothetical protein
LNNSYIYYNCALVGWFTDNKECTVRVLTKKTQYLYLLFLCCHNGYTNASQCYVIRALPALLSVRTEYELEIFNPPNPKFWSIFCQWFSDMWKSFCLFACCLFVCMFVCLLACLFVCLFICLPACLFACLFIWLIDCLFDFLLTCLFTCLFIYLFVCLFVYLFICLFACLFACLFTCLFVCLFICLFIYLLVSLLVYLFVYLLVSLLVYLLVIWWFLCFFVVCLFICLFFVCLFVCVFEGSQVSADCVSGNSNMYGALAERYSLAKTETARWKPFPLPLYPSQIPHGLALDRNLACALRGRQRIVQAT